jgi:pimeloyl-ACP methyl ester carboxylesterase
MRRQLLFAVFGLLLIAAGLAADYSTHIRRTDGVMDDGCRTPVSVYEASPEPPVGSAVVIHGLAGNRRVMKWLDQWLAAQRLRVYSIDLPGHGDSTEPFTYARAEECTERGINALAARGDIQLDRTVLLGHSLGGEIAIRMSDRFPTAGTIALSPAPMVLPRRVPNNLLVLSAQFDLPPLRAEAREIAAAAGGERVAPEDFAQLRAFQFSTISWADHVSPLVDERPEMQAATWAREALAEAGPLQPVRGWPRTGAVLCGIGLLLLFPLAALLIAGHPPQPYPPRDPQIRITFVHWLTIRTLVARWAVASALAVALFSLTSHYNWLRLYNGSYLVSCMLVAGLALLLLFRRQVASLRRPRLRGIFAAIVLALAFAMAAHAWVGFSLDIKLINAMSFLRTLAGGFWLSAPRWLRLGPATLAVLPYFAAEELALGEPNLFHYWRRLGVCLLLRLELWLLMLLAIYATMNGQVLILLLAPTFLFLSVLQRLGSDVLRIRTGSPAAGAVFGAILAGWFIASVFPLT